MACNIKIRNENQLITFKQVSNQDQTDELRDQQYVMRKIEK